MGYAGWEAGQLEQEVVDNDWLLGEASQKLVFDTPIAEQWTLAAKDIGFERSQLMTQVGHA